MLAILWWSTEYLVTDMAMGVEITEKSACDIYNWLCKTCCTRLLRMAIVLGGQGIIVQIDESLFKHKPKVCFIMYNV